MEKEKKKMKYRDIFVFFLCLSFVISIYYFYNCQIEANAITISNNDETLFWVGLIVIIISSVILFVFFAMQDQKKTQDFDGGRYWLSLFIEKN